MSVCRSCGAPIEWVKSAKEGEDGKPPKTIPVDPAYVTVVTDDGRVERGHISHFASCPFADKHRHPRT